MKFRFIFLFIFFLYKIYWIIANNNFWNWKENCAEKIERKKTCRYTSKMFVETFSRNSIFIMSGNSQKKKRKILYGFPMFFRESSLWFQEDFSLPFLLDFDKILLIFKDFLFKYLRIVLNFLEFVFEQMDF